MSASRTQGGVGVALKLHQMMPLCPAAAVQLVPIEWQISTLCLSPEIFEAGLDDNAEQV